MAAATNIHLELRVEDNAGNQITFLSTGGAPEGNLAAGLYQVDTL